VSVFSLSPPRGGEAGSRGVRAAARGFNLCRGSVPTHRRFCLFWRYAFDEAYSLTSQMWWRPMSPPVLVMLLTVTAFVVLLVRVGVFG
jgi:hypothetical protein